MDLFEPLLAYSVGPSWPDNLQDHKYVGCSQDLLRTTEMSSGETLVEIHGFFFFFSVLFD